MASIETAAEQWSSLPNDLLGMVHALLASPGDRVCFAAVCASWRAFALTNPPRPVLPWLMLDLRGGDKTKHVYCPGDDAVLPRVPIPSEAAGGCLIGAYDGGWVVSSQAPLGIVNLFSGDKVVYLSPEQKSIIHAQQSSENRLVLRKVIFSEVPTSGGCILAAITDKHDLALCKVDYPVGGWTTPRFTRSERRLADIAFCNGKLYGIYPYDVLIAKFEITLNQHGAPVVTAVHRINIAYVPNYVGILEENPRYIVELRGRLVMVFRYCQWPHWRIYFKVVELVDDGVDGDRSEATYKYRWVEMTSLGDHALFLGPTCSKAVHLPPEEVGHGGVKRNHAYYSYQRCLRRGDDENPLGVKVKSLKSSTDDCDPLYYREDESVNGGVEQITYVEYFVKDGAYPPLWILPPNI